MSRVLYEVTATIVDRETAARWVDWMFRTHIDEVVHAGALGCRVVRIDGTENCYVAQYEFASREALDAYLRDHAPRLRADGQRQFSPDQVVLSRRIGDVLPLPGE